MALFERWLEETAHLNRPGRPLVTLSYAQALDGSIAKRRGEPTSISGPESLEFTHRLRAAHDAILVGIGTVISDDPQLNVRFAKGNDPQIVVLDSQLRLPLQSKLLENSRKAWVFCVAGADEHAQIQLEKMGVKVERQPGGFESVDLDLMLTRLAELGMKSVMVEGGGEVISSFLSHGFADRAMITMAPVNLYGYKLNGSPLAQMKDVQTEDAGKDMILFGRFERATA